MVIFRYALASLFESRLFVIFFSFCFLPSVVAMVMIYMRYNLEMIMQFELRLNELLTINAEFFAQWVQLPQLAVTFVMIMLIGPTLVSPDLRNNALSLYLSRSISQPSYVLGKLLVLLVLCSVVTWIPALLLVLFQSYLAGSNWLMENLNLIIAPVLMSLAWIISLSMMSLAVSAWVKWKVISRLVFFGIFFMGSALSAIIREVFGGWTGSILSISDLSEVMIATLYGVTTWQRMPFSVAISVFIVITLGSAYLLSKRIRAFEVVS